MGPLVEGVALSVERPAPQVVVIRVAGEWDRVTAARLGTLIAHQLRCGRAHAGARVRDLIVDLAEIRCFGEVDLQVLERAHRRAAEADARLRVTGLSARAALLPEAVTAALAHLPTAPTVEHALP